VTIDFNMCNEEPLKSDFIAIYPCDADTFVANQDWWDNKVCQQFPAACGDFKYGYTEGETYGTFCGGWARTSRDPPYLCVMSHLAFFSHLSSVRRSQSTRPTNGLLGLADHQWRADAKLKIAPFGPAKAPSPWTRVKPMLDGRISVAGLWILAATKWSCSAK